MSSYIRDIVRFRARRTPDREAILDWDSGIRYSWKDVANRVDKLSSFLVHSLGVHKGDRVGFLSPNNIRMIDMFFASYDTGAIITTYNYRLLACELTALAETECPKVLFFSSECRDKARAISDRLVGTCTLICLDEEYGPENRYTVSDIDATEIKPFEPRAIDRSDPQMLIHTGGTTGLPKAAILSFWSIFMNSISEILSWQLSGDDSAYIGMPLYHTAGWNVLLLPLLMMGGKVVISRCFSADTFFDVVAQERPTTFLGADAMFRCIVGHRRFEEADLSCFKWVMGGGGPMSIAAMEPFWDRGVKAFVGYGMTETGPNNVSPDVSEPLEANRAKPYSLGKELLFTEVRVINEQGEETKPNEFGEIHMRGELSFSGYWGCQNEALTQDDDAWIHTGDMGFRDEEGDLAICGRTKHMYISGGENIFPAEIERCIEGHPLVKEACVFGVPDKRWGEVGKALIVVEPNEDLSLDILKQYLGASLSTIKQPRFFALVPSIPKNTAGKRDEKKISALYSCAE